MAEHTTTRNAAIAAHVALAIRHTGSDMNAYAARVFEIYSERTPLPLRTINVHQHVRGSNAYDVLRANAQTVHRYLDGTSRMPVELEEALVMALPLPYQTECQRELAARMGLLAASLPPTCDVPGHAPALSADAIAHLLRETGDVVQATAAIVADGAITREDLPRIELALEQVGQLEAALVTLRAQLSTARGIAGTVTPMRGRA